VKWLRFLKNCRATEEEDVWTEYIWLGTGTSDEIFANAVMNLWVTYWREGDFLYS
jgi:hypothetical protein